MEKSELLKHCRYYKGEKENPYEDKDPNKVMLWFYERGWIYDTLQGHSFNEMLADYKAYGLEQFRVDDGIPLSLKALLFNRYAKTGYSMTDSVEPFMEFYNKYYE